MHLVQSTAGDNTGSFGYIFTCRFYPVHQIIMGEGSEVLTVGTLLKNIIASFRDWGRDCWCDPGCEDTCDKRFGWQHCSLPAGYDQKYIYSHVGYNPKVTDMQAAIGVEQLKKLPMFIEARCRNFVKSFSSLSGIPHLNSSPKNRKIGA